VKNAPRIVHDRRTRPPVRHSAPGPKLDRSPRHRLLHASSGAKCTQDVRKLKMEIFHKLQNTSENWVLFSASEISNSSLATFSVLAHVLHPKKPRRWCEIMRIYYDIKIEERKHFFKSVLGPRVGRIRSRNSDFWNPRKNLISQHKIEFCKLICTTICIVASSFRDGAPASASIAERGKNGSASSSVFGIP
jgi:hypothetical protein